MNQTDTTQQADLLQIEELETRLEMASVSGEGSDPGYVECNCTLTIPF